LGSSKSLNAAAEMDGENRIILNVGGFRFETYKVNNALPL
jgi:hypothetical protein